MTALSLKSTQPEIRPFGLPQAENKVLRIAYVIQNAGNDLAEDVGQAILIKQTIRGLQEAGHQVDVLRLQGRSVVKYNSITNLQDVDEIPLGFSGTKLFKLFESAVRRVQGVLKLPYLAFFDTFRFYEACNQSLSEYTLCHEYSGILSLGATLACWRQQIPHVVTVEADYTVEQAVSGKSMNGLQAWIAAWEAKLTYKLADKIICVSEAAKQSLIESWHIEPEKFVVMANGVDTKLFNPAHDPAPIRAKFSLGNAPVITFVGGFQPWHGLDCLVESFSLVLAEIPEARLFLVGDGPARASIERKIVELGLESSVIITGFVPQVQVPEMLSAADIAVLPYPKLPKELWFSPLKLYEYMAAGKAIVASRAGQIAEVIRDGQNGLLVEPGNVSQLAQALIKLIKDPYQRRQLGQTARQKALDQHSWEKYINRLEAVYLSIL